MFIVMELQTYADQSLGTLVNTYSSRAEAESKYHTILASAAISTVPVHTAVLMNEYGMDVMSRSYEHPVEDEPEVEEVVSE